MLTDLQKAALRRVRSHELAGGADAWFRSETAGDRVTLASLDSRGLLRRRPWRGDGISRDSAFEYRLADELRDALNRKTAERQVAR